MKTRNGFVSNSSSMSFIIRNKSDKTLTIVDFVKENPQLVENFKETYDWYKKDPMFNQTRMIEDAERRLKDNIAYYTLNPKSMTYMDFGDEDGDVIGNVLDYILRDGGKSENFEWEYHQALR